MLFNLSFLSHFNSQFLFVVTFTTFLVTCVDYDVLFANRVVNHTGPGQNPLDRNKVTIPDAILPTQQCTERYCMFLLVFCNASLAPILHFFVWVMK